MALWAKRGDRASRHDEIQVDGRRVNLEEVGRYVRVLAYNKPVGKCAAAKTEEPPPRYFSICPKPKTSAGSTLAA